jgi:guanylate kinase
MAGKLIIFSAPSGSGKSTIINYLLTQNLNLSFSISATSRAPRGTEQNGVEYFFLTPEEFKQRIANNEFLEYEEVYKDRFYGTLKAQVEKQLAAGQNVIFDVDVVGGCNIKKFYGDRALSVFIQPPSLEELRKRLTGRGSYRKPSGKSDLRAELCRKIRCSDCQRQFGKGSSRSLEDHSRFYSTINLLICLKTQRKSCS